MTGRANRWLYGPFLAAGVILIGWFLVWRAGADIMRKGLDEFAGTRSAEGYVVAFEPIKARGFPFFLRGVANDFSVARGDQRYDCARLYIDALPYALDRIIFSCGDRQVYAANGREWMIDAKDAKASLGRDKARGWMVKVQTGAAAAASEGQSLSIDDAILNLAPAEPGDGSVDASLRVIGVRARAEGGDYAIDRLDAAITVSTADASGVQEIAIHGIEALVGETKLAAEGSFAIPASGDVAGRLNGRIEKPAGLARALAAAGLIEKRDAQTAEAGLAMLSLASGGVISAPIDVRNNEIRIAGVRLARIKRSAQP